MMKRKEIVGVGNYHEFTIDERYCPCLAQMAGGHLGR